MISSTTQADLNVGDQVLYRVIVVSSDGISSSGTAERMVLNIDIETMNITYHEKTVLGSKVSETDVTRGIDDLSFIFNPVVTDDSVSELLTNCENTYEGKLILIQYENKDVSVCSLSQFFPFGALAASVQVGPFPFGFYSTTFKDLAKRTSTTYEFDRLVTQKK